MPEKKAWWLSRTLWVNAVAAALLAAEAASGVIEKYIGGNVYVIVAVALPAVNAMLRVFTNSSITRRR